MMLSAIISRFSSLVMPSATSTWKSHALPTMQTDWALAFSRALRPGSLAALRPGRRVMPNATSLARFRVGGWEKKASSVGLAPGQPPST